MAIEMNIFELSVKHLANSLRQSKEVIAASIIPRDLVPWWCTPDPRGGFHERKRQRIKAFMILKETHGHF